MALACVDSETVAPLTMFKALRTQMDELGVVPDHRIHGLSELPALLAVCKVLNIMSLESVRAFFAEKAPDISVIESTTELSDRRTGGGEPMVSNRRASPRR